MIINARMFRCSAWLVLALSIAVGGTTARGQAPTPKPKPKPAPGKEGVYHLELTPVKEAKPSLEKLLEEALQNNPDIHVAELKLREAEAELKRTRLQVMQKVVASQHALQEQRHTVDHLGVSFQRMQALAKSAAVEHSAVEDAQKKLLSAKGKLAEMESQLPFLLGKHAFSIRFHVVDGEGEGIRGGDKMFVFRALQTMLPTPAPAGGVAGKLRKVLDKPISVDFNEVPLNDVLKSFEDKHGVAFVIVNKQLGEKKVALRAADLSFGAILEMLEDTQPGLHIAVRDYGVLVTSSERLPTGAVPLYLFWKGAGQQHDAKVAPK